MDYILEIDNAVSKEFCEDVISRFENDERQVIGSTIGGVDEDVKKSIDLAISAPSIRGDWRDVIDKVGNCVSDGLKTYQKYVNEEGLDRCFTLANTIEISTIGLPQIQKTEKDGFYSWHHDGHLNRILTYIIYLNDVEESAGGTTDFLCGKKIQPKTGKLVIFPANLTYLHRGAKLKDGVKYLLTNFIYEGPPIMMHPKDEHLGKETNGTSKMESVEEEIPEPENDEI